MSEKVFLVFNQVECDDPYYPPYQKIISVYKYKEKAIEEARKCYNRSKNYMNKNDCYYVVEHMYDDKEINNSNPNDEVHNDVQNDHTNYNDKFVPEEIFPKENEECYNNGLRYIISIK